MSEWFDVPARRLITRAYAVKGGWAGVYLAPPTREQRRHLEAVGVFDPYQRDRWGEARWVRGFKRSVFHNLNWYGGVAELRARPNTGAGTHGWHAPVRGQWETGAMVRKLGWPTRRWAIRLAIHPGGDVTSRIGQGEARRWIDDEGHPGFRQSTAADHDWE